MRAVVQRVLSASVTVEGEKVSEIGPGFLVLLGVGKGDGDAELERDCNDALDRCSRARAVLHADNCGCSAD